MCFKDTDISLCKSKIYNDGSNKDKKYYNIDYAIYNYPIPNEAFYVRNEDIKEVVWKGYSDD